MLSVLWILPFLGAVWSAGVIADAVTNPTLEGVLTEAAKQIPALCALIWIVYQFLGHLRALAQTYATALDKVSTSLDKSTEMLGRVSEVCGRMEDALNDAVEAEKDRVRAVDRGDKR